VTDPEEDEAPAERKPIPRELWSEHDEAPFKSCSDCGASLQEDGALHVIGKAWRDSEVVFEFALCLQCSVALFSQYSEESKQNLAKYFVPLEGVTPSGVEACFRCGRTGEGLSEERSVEAVAFGASLADEPIAVCGPCTDGAEKVLSKKTKEAFDDFVRRVCPTLPADVDLPAPIFSLP
jgi:hypothetical protein